MSNAISTQGTRFEVQAAAAGSAKTITAITKANPGVFSSTAHGLKVGDVVDLAAIVGMVELNGRTGIVSPTTLAAGTFTLLDSITGLPIDTTSYTTYTSGGTATPKTFVETIEHKSYQYQPAARAEIEKTSMVSTAKEFNLGLKDFGTLSVGMNIVKTEAAQIRMNAALNLQGLWFRLTDPLGVPTLFQGAIKSFSESGGVDAIANGSLEVRLSGEKIIAQ